MRTAVSIMIVFYICCCIPVSIFAAGEEIDLMSEPNVYTLVSLHPDEQNNRLYTVNYQLPGFIPMCSAVEILSLNDKKLTFKVIGRNKTYTYLYHKTSPESLKEHLNKFFGPKCNNAEVKKLSEVDQNGISMGRASIGMTKKGVLYALGYPPMHVTYSLDMNVWTYWKNRFVKMEIEFDKNGLVTAIR
ncbi:MAG: outer membrane protein assembly factor BamE [Desulfobacterales bacterium]|nr:outer membrane protein assembly factor BamE [Desulfobacterales bacterium]